MLIYDLKPNRDVSKRFKYHVFKKPHKKNGKNSRRDDHAGDDDDENKETLEDVLSMYGITESQFRAWNDMITGHPVAGLSDSELIPHIVTKLATKEPTRAQYHWGGSQREVRVYGDVIVRSRIKGMECAK